MPRPCCAARESSCTSSGVTRPGRAAQSAKIIGRPVSRFHSRPRSMTWFARTSKPRSPMTSAPFVPLARASPSTAGRSVYFGRTPISSRTSLVRTCDVREAVSRNTSSQIAGDCSPASTTVWTGPSAPMAMPGTTSNSPPGSAPTETRARSTSPASSIAAHLDGSARIISIRSDFSSPAVSGHAFRKETAAARSLGMGGTRRGGGLGVGGGGPAVDPEDAVQRVALRRDAARRADELVQRALAQRLRHRRPGHVVDALLEHGPVDVVDAEGERDLGEPLAERHPVRLHVVEVVEVQAGDGERPERVVAGRLRERLPDHVVLGVEGERDEDLEPARLVLQLAEAPHVLDPLVEPLDVAVEHRRVRLDPEAVGGPVDLEPLLRGRLVVADLPAHARREDLRAAARHRHHPGRLELAEDLLVALPVLLRPEVDLDRGER